MTTKTTKKLFAYTIFENADKNRVWVYYCCDRPELVPGYWNLDTEGIENVTANKWAKNGNEWIRAMHALGCSYDEMVAAVRRVMDAQGFEAIEEFDPASVGAVDYRFAS